MLEMEEGSGEEEFVLSPLFSFYCLFFARFKEKSVKFCHHYDFKAYFQHFFTCNCLFYYMLYTL